MKKDQHITSFEGQIYKSKSKYIVKRSQNETCKEYRKV